MIPALITIIVLLVIQIIQLDVRLHQTLKEVRSLRVLAYALHR